MTSHEDSRQRWSVRFTFRRSDKPVSSCSYSVLSRYAEVDWHWPCHICCGHQTSEMKPSSTKQIWLHKWMLPSQRLHDAHWYVWNGTSINSYPILYSTVTHSDAPWSEFPCITLSHQHPSVWYAVSSLHLLLDFFSWQDLFPTCAPDKNTSKRYEHETGESQGSDSDCFDFGFSSVEKLPSEAKLQPGLSATNNVITCLTPTRSYMFNSIRDRNLHQEAIKAPKKHMRFTKNDNERSKTL